MLRRLNCLWRGNVGRNGVMRDFAFEGRSHVSRCKFVCSMIQTCAAGAESWQKERGSRSSGVSTLL